MLLCLLVSPEAFPVSSQFMLEKHEFCTQFPKDQALARWVNNHPLKRKWLSPKKENAGSGFCLFPTISFPLLVFRLSVPIIPFPLLILISNSLMNTTRHITGCTFPVCGRQPWFTNPKPPTHKSITAVARLEVNSRRFWRCPWTDLRSSVLISTTELPGVLSTALGTEAAAWL